MRLIKIFIIIILLAPSMLMAKPKFDRLVFSASFFKDWYGAVKCKPSCSRENGFFSGTIHYRSFAIGVSFIKPKYYYKFEFSYAITPTLILVDLKLQGNLANTVFGIGSYDMPYLGFNFSVQKNFQLYRSLRIYTTAGVQIRNYTQSGGSSTTKVFSKDHLDSAIYYEFRHSILLPLPNIEAGLALFNKKGKPKISLGCNYFYSPILLTKGTYYIKRHDGLIFKGTTKFKPSSYGMKLTYHF